jgi:hypothetical protein
MVTWEPLFVALALAAIGGVALELRRRELNVWAEQRRVELNGRETFLLAEKAEVRKKHALLNWKLAHLRKAIAEMFPDDWSPAEAAIDHLSRISITRYDHRMEAVDLPEVQTLDLAHDYFQVPVLTIECGLLGRLGRRMMGRSIKVEARYGEVSVCKAVAVPISLAALMDEMPLVKRQIEYLAEEAVWKVAAEAGGAPDELLEN